MKSIVPARESTTNAPLMRQPVKSTRTESGTRSASLLTIGRGERVGLQRSGVMTNEGAGPGARAIENDAPLLLEPVEVAPSLRPSASSVIAAATVSASAALSDGVLVGEVVELQAPSAATAASAVTPTRAVRRPNMGLLRFALWDCREVCRNRSSDGDVVALLNRALGAAECGGGAQSLLQPLRSDRASGRGAAARPTPRPVTSCRARSTAPPGRPGCRRRHPGCPRGSA